MSLNVIAGIAAVVAAVSAGFFTLVRALRRGAAQSGRQEITIKQQKGALDVVDKAKRVAEAARSGSDSAWIDRVRRKYRRP